VTLREQVAKAIAQVIGDYPTQNSCLDAADEAIKIIKSAAEAAKGAGPKEFWTRGL
jgi:hypothetical protein